MNDGLMETLLRSGESSSLDFKRELVALKDGTDEKNSELLKDVLAFVNAWRQGDAYILIGVAADAEGRYVACGMDSPPFDDAHLQQFINYKTNRPVSLHFEPYVFDGKTIGVIRIPKQQRPVYAVKDFGKVKAGVIYYRQGSSTAIAKPEEVHRMGVSDAKADAPGTPLLSLKFTDAEHHRELGQALPLSNIVHQPHDGLPDARGSEAEERYGTAMINRRYWRELAEFVETTRFVEPVTFAITNESSVLARNVRVEMVIDPLAGVVALAAADLPAQPQLKQDFLRGLTVHNRNLADAIKRRPGAGVRRHGNVAHVTLDAGDVQPKATCWIDEPIYIGALESGDRPIICRIFGDNIPEPQTQELMLRWTVDARPSLTIAELREIHGGLSRST